MSQVTMDSEGYNALLFGKTNIGGYFFDAFIDVEYTREATLTQSPVQTGAAITDHAYLNPVKLTMTVGMSDVMQSRVAGQFEGGWSRSRNAWDVLVKMQEDRVPMSVLTRLGRYDNMLIRSLKQKDDFEELYALHATVELEQIIVVQTKKATVSLSPQVTGSTQSGTVQAMRIDRSILSYLTQLQYVNGEGWQ